jgi:hypothetical protein
MGFLLMMKIMAAGGPLSRDKGHYMGPNLGLFWQTGAYKRPNLQRSKSDGFTGDFLTLLGETTATWVRTRYSARVILSWDVLTVAGRHGISAPYSFGVMVEYPVLEQVNRMLGNSSCTRERRRIYSRKILVSMRNIRLPATPKPYAGDPRMNAWYQDLQVSLQQHTGMF